MLYVYVYMYSLTKYLTHELNKYIYVFSQRKNSPCKLDTAKAFIPVFNLAINYVNKNLER